LVTWAPHPVVAVATTEVNALEGSRTKKRGREGDLVNQPYARRSIFGGEFPNETRGGGREGSQRKGGKYGGGGVGILPVLRNHLRFAINKGGSGGRGGVGKGCRGRRITRGV